MRLFATRRHRVLGLMVLVMVPLALVAARADAQVSPLWDHYKVYFVNPPIPADPAALPVTLTDQFTTSTHQVLFLEQFANPVEKTPTATGQTFPINDPLLHYTWWKIETQPFTAVVTATNQFGDHTLNVLDAQFLLNPALKNQAGQPPLANHYKCYDCEGPPVNVDVTMVDQFDSWTALVTIPRFFCNPAEKQVGPPGTGQNFPIVDPNQHYVCYEYQPADPGTFTATITDQFIADRSVALGPSQLICVPTYKSGVTPTNPSTWGRIKVLYR